MKSFMKNVFSTMLGTLIAAVIALALLPLVIAVVVMALHGTNTEPINKHSILHLRMSGSLVERHRPLDFDFLSGGGPFRGDEHTIGLYELTRALDLAAKDPRFDGVYLELRDLDAGWASLTSLHRHLTEFAKSGKWVYAYANRLDERTHYLATAATKIFLEPHGDLELDGLSVDSAFLKGLFEKLELEPRIFRVGKFKAAIEPLIRENMSDENRAQLQELVGDIWSVVRSDLARVAKTEPARVDELAAGLRVTSASDAQSSGLVHELAFEDQVDVALEKSSVGEGEELELVNAGRLLKDSAPQGDHKAKKVAVIFAEGEITSSSGGIDEIGSQGIRQDILDAKEDEEVGAIVLRVNSPGGDALASDVIWRELRVADEAIPVVVSMGDMAASGGYYIAAAGRYVFAEPTTITGSIGVFGVLFGTQKFFKEKAGVSFDRVVTHPFADLGNPNRPMDPAESATIQRDVERVYKRFIDVVHESRGYKNREDVESLAEGRVWSGLKAKELGLVDELGGLKQAINKAAELASLGENFRIESYPKRGDPLREIFDRLAGDTIESWMGKEAMSRVRELATSVKALPMKSGVYARLPGVLHIH